MAGAAGAPDLTVTLSRIDLARGGQGVLHGIDWTIAPGERWALVGANGAGKTQLLKLVAGDVWPTPTGREVRHYCLGEELASDPYGIKDEIAYLGPERQDRYERYGWNHPVSAIVGTGIHRSDIPLDSFDDDERREIALLLERLQIAGLAQREFLTLSYGERRLVLLARALAARPRLLLLDECTNGLDEENRRRFLAFLERDDLRIPWVFASHRVEDVPRTANRLLVLRAGRVRRRGPLTPAALRQAFGDSYRRAAPRVPAARRPAARVIPAAPAQLLQMRNASVWLDERAVLQDVSLALREGECWVVHGPNGAGKSTLLRTLYGDHGVATGGTLRREGIEPGVPLEAFRRRVGFIAPALQSDQPADLPVTQVVASGRYASIGLNDAPTRADRTAALAALADFGLTHLAERSARELSYGQLRRVLFARAWVCSPRLLLLDEPFAGVDTQTRIALLARLDRLAMETLVTIVLATHHRNEWPRSTTHELHLMDGRVRYCGVPRRRRVTRTGPRLARRSA